MPPMSVASHRICVITSALGGGLAGLATGDSGSEARNFAPVGNVIPAVEPVLTTDKMDREQIGRDQEAKGGEKGRTGEP
jgi:hypothetical protein